MWLDSAVLYTRDIKKVTKFYSEVIGLQIEHKEAKFVSFISPNGVRISIKKAVEKREVPGRQTIFIGTDDIESKFREVKTKKVVVQKELAVKPWGKEFSVLDPDNNKVAFIQRNK